jgi:hypothetical protein
MWAQEMRSNMATQTRKTRKNSGKPQAPLTKFVVLARQTDGSWREFREYHEGESASSHAAVAPAPGESKVKIVEARVDSAAIAQLVDPLTNFGSYKAIPLRSWKGGVTYAEPQSVANKQPLDEEFG